MKIFELYFNGGNEIKFMVDVNENVWAEFVVTVSHLKRNMYVATATEFSAEPVVTDTKFLETTDIEHTLPNAEFMFDDTVKLFVTPQSVEVTVL